MALVALRLRIMRRAAATDAGTAAVAVVVRIVVMVVVRVRVVRVRRRLGREATAAQHTDVARVARTEGSRRASEQVVNRRGEGLRRGAEAQAEVVAVRLLIEARVVAGEAAVQGRHRRHIT